LTGDRNKDRKERYAEEAFTIDQSQLNGIRPGIKIYRGQEGDDR